MNKDNEKIDSDNDNNSDDDNDDGNLIVQVHKNSKIDGVDSDNHTAFDTSNKGQYRIWGKVIDGKFPSSCVVGPDFICLLFAYLLILIPSFLVICYVAPNIHWIISLIGFINLCCVMYFLSYTAFSDPGIIPKRPPSKSQNPKPNSEQLRQRRVFCPYCNILRPVNSFHCSYCDACILNLDHHCPVSYFLNKPTIKNKS